MADPSGGVPGDPPRYFVSIGGFKDGTAYVRADANGNCYGVQLDGDEWLYTAGRLEAFVEKVQRGIWRELTADEAFALVAASSASGTVPQGWQPIVTAPKDGTLVLISNGQHVVPARWVDAAWYEMNNDPTDTWGQPWYEGEATHWMALPNPPTAASCAVSDATMEPEP